MTMSEVKRTWIHSAFESDDKEEILDAIEEIEKARERVE
jgi:hypothetical protein